MSGASGAELDAGMGGAVDAQTAQKVMAARAAVAEIPDGAVVGLGSGSTAELMLVELAARTRAGLRVTGVATSERTRAVAGQLGIALAELDAVGRLTVSIDGADEVALPRLDLVKGRGGALLREKIIAAASNFRVIIVDETKLVPTLGAHYAVPVEVVPFGWRHTAGALTALGAQVTPRLVGDGQTVEQAGGQVGQLFVTDGGHYILDCQFGAIGQPEALAQALSGVVGVVEHGLFVGMTERVIVAGVGGTRVFDRAR